MPRDFIPCSDHCPAVTGEPYGSVQYCPKQENERHHRFMHEHSGHREMIRDANGDWTQLDWRSGEHVVVNLHEDPEIPMHPDDTDCCIDFGCCAEKIAKSPLAGVLTRIADAAKRGGGVVTVTDPINDEPRGDA